MQNTRVHGLKVEMLMFSDTSAKDAIEGLIKNKELRAILLGQFLDVGLPPKDLPFPMQLSVQAHYSEVICLQLPD